MKIRYAVFRTAFGWCGLVRGQGGLRRIFLPEAKKKPLKERIKKEYPGCCFAPEGLGREIEGIKGYFAGSRETFSLVLDFSGATGFQRRVWAETAKIPYGKTMTYGEVAERIGNKKAFRAVGTALAKNPFPVVIPCHRVVKAGGMPGGFSAAEGETLKRKMLQLENDHC